jgi:hypothetical protein
MLATIVDWSAIWKVFVVALACGVGLTALFGEGVVSLERLAAARRSGRTGAILLSGATVALTALVCLAALIAGFIAMTHK